MKKLFQVLILSVALCSSMLFGVSCSDSKNVNNFPNIDVDGYSAPAPITQEVKDMSKGLSSNIMMYTSALEGKNKFITRNVLDYGAAANGVKDDSVAIISALTDASKDKGGIVFMPKGNYMVKKQLVIPSNVTLLGEWLPSSSENFETGTTIYVGIGKGDASIGVESAFIRCSAASKVANLNIYYPEQSAVSPVPYPYTFSNNAYLGFNLENINIINPYRGVKVVNHNVLFFDNINMTPIKEGMYIDICYDIPRYYNFNIGVDTWVKYSAAIKQTSLVTAVQLQEVFDDNDTIGLRFGRQDWAYLYNININDVEKGIVLESSSNGQGAFNGQMYNVNMRNVNYGFYFEEVTGCGVSVAYAGIDAKISAIYTSRHFQYPSQILFNLGCFQSTGDCIVNNGDGALQFTECSIIDWIGYAVKNMDTGYLGFDSCNFAASKPKTIYYAASVVSSSIVNCTFNSPPVVDNNSDSEKIQLKNVAVSKKIARLNVTKKFGLEKRKAAREVIFFASAYGAKADASYLNTNLATDNTIAIQTALNYAGSIGGGIVYLEAGDYYVKNYLVVPEGVELRGVSDNNRHFGINQKGTTIITDNEKNNSKGIPFLSLKAKSGLVGINLFYLDQHYKYHIEYSPTVLVDGRDAYIYNVTIPNAYVGVFVQADNVHVDYLRTLGVKACLVLNNANGAYIENIMFSGGDWQDAEKLRMLNAPPMDLWMNHPNYSNEGIYVSDSKNVTLFNCFVFGMGNGLHLVRNVENLTSIGLGVDAADNAVYLENSGVGNTLVNNQLVGNSNYIKSSSFYTGETSMYLSAMWFNAMDVRSTFEGSGTVNIQQAKVQNGGMDIKTANVYMQNFMFDIVTFTMLDIAPQAKGYMLNSVGTINILRTEGEAKDFEKINLGTR